MTLPTLYSQTARGQVHTWTIETEGDKFRTIHGLQGGKLQTTEWTVCQPTNEDRSNARTAEEQAESEALSLWNKKKQSGCFEDPALINTKLFFEPMLAQKFDDRERELVYPIFSSAKLDGSRCIATPTRLHSRNGKEWVSVPHLRIALERFFEENPTLSLDGELYNHELHDDFNKIMSLVRKTKPTAKDLHESEEKIQYWVYDVYDSEHPELTFEQRLNLLHTKLGPFCNKSVQILQCNKVLTREGLDEFYGAYLQQGFEGQIVRVAEGTYENKRSKNLLKRKQFQDQEYTILDICEGEGNKTGMCGYMVFENELGLRFNSNVKGDRAYLKELLANKDSYIGKAATIRFFNKTPDNLLPRFPYVYGIATGAQRND